MSQGKLEIHESDPVTIDGRFDRYHDSHPEVYHELVKLARRMVRAGRSRYGISALCEVMRWNLSLQKPDSEPYKLNNDYRACYARLIMQQESDLAGFFETRARSSRRMAA